MDDGTIRKSMYVSSIKSRYGITTKSASRVYDINKQLKKIRKDNKYYLKDPEYGSLFVEKTRLQFRDIILN